MNIDFSVVQSQVARSQSADPLTAARQLQGGDTEAAEVAKEFEAILINQMFKAMRSSLNKEEDPLYGGFAQDIYEDMLYEKYSQSLASQGSLGIAAMIERSIEQSQGTTAPLAAARAYQNA